MKDENHKTISDELIAKYLAGEASPEEAMWLHEWRAEESNQLYFKSFQSAWSGAYPDKQSRISGKEQAWQKISKSISKADKPEAKQVFFKHYKLSLKVAASLAFVMVSIWLVYNQFATSVKDLNLHSADAPQSVQLPDESHVTLSQNSTLTYKEGFKEKPREVTLYGEAFFKVKPDPDHPFIVHTEKGDVKVLGTSFNVSTHNNQLEVGVVEGKVLVYTLAGDNYDSRYLLAGQTALLTDQNSIVVQNAVNLNNAGYATHTFVFKDTPMKEVIRCIKKAYPDFIEVDNKSIENCRLTATFENTSAENIISLLAESLDLTVSKNGQTFVLQGKGCP